MTESRVSVVLPVYNAEKYLCEAIESILRQNYTDFEFIIINDGSTDKSKEIIYSYSDTRIRYKENDSNIGLPETLNKAIALAKGQYIVRMDNDDVALPQRIERQITFMDSNPEIGVCGAWYKIFGTKEELIQNPITHNDILLHMLFKGNPFGHATVVFRKELWQQNNLFYNPFFYPCDDYNLWITLINKTRFYNYPEILQNYRWHNENISLLKRKLISEKNELNKFIAFEKVLKRDLTDCLKKAITLLNKSIYTDVEFTHYDLQKIEHLYLSVIDSVECPDAEIINEAITAWEKRVAESKWFYIRKLFLSKVIKYSNLKFRDRIYYLRHFRN